MAILDPANGGPPAVCWVDNGKDFDSFALHGVTKNQRKAGQFHVEFDQQEFGGIFGLLGIEAHFSVPFGPQGKARCERWFATLADRFDKAFPTYSGPSTDRKPERLNSRLKNDRNVPDFWHLRERLGNFIAGHNARDEHTIDDLVDKQTGELLSPDRAMQQWRQVRREPADPAALEMCMQLWHQPVRAGRNGIALRIAGQTVRFGQFDHALASFKRTREKLFVAYDPADLSAIRVFDNKMRLITLAERNQTGGQHGQVGQIEDVKRLARRKAEYRKALRVVRGSRELEYLTNEELLADTAARDGHTPQRPDTPAIQPVVTPLDGQADAIGRSMRKAAGAEHQDIDQRIIDRLAENQSQGFDRSDSLLDSDEPLSRFAERMYGDGGDDADEFSIFDWAEPDGSSPVDALAEWKQKQEDRS